MNWAFFLEISKLSGSCKVFALKNIYISVFNTQPPPPPSAFFPLEHKEVNQKKKQKKKPRSIKQQEKINLRLEYRSGLEY